MLVKEILSSKGRAVSTVRSDLTIGAFAARLKEEQVGAMVVVGATGEIEGIISERDVIRGLGEFGGAVTSKRVCDLMTPKVLTCTPNEAIADVARRMTTRRIRHLPVVENGRLAGIVSIGDVLKSRIDEVELEANVLRDVAIAVRH